MLIDPLKLVYRPATVYSRVNINDVNNLNVSGIPLSVEEYTVATSKYALTLDVTEIYLDHDPDLETVNGHSPEEPEEIEDTCLELDNQQSHAVGNLHQIFRLTYRYEPNRVQNLIAIRDIPELNDYLALHFYPGGPVPDQPHIDRTHAQLKKALHYAYKNGITGAN